MIFCQFCIRGVGILRLLADQLSDTIENKGDVAYYRVAAALERSFGPGDEARYTFKQANREGKPVVWVKSGKEV